MTHEIFIQFLDVEWPLSMPSSEAREATRWPMRFYVEPHVNDAVVSNDGRYVAIIHWLQHRDAGLGVGLLVQGQLKL